MTTEVPVHRLSWRDVDPARHPFDRASALTVIRALGPADRVPTRPSGTSAPKPSTAGSFGEGWEWTDAMTRSLVERYGPWAGGWRWALDEGEIGGGPVHAWCCPRHSITTPDATLALVAEALVEWRSWLEDLAERFDRYPLDAPSADDRRHAWERATIHLVNHVVDRTAAGDAWYAHCAQVLTWFLTRWGVDEGTARTAVEQAIGGRFASWLAPERVVVDGVAERLAASHRPDGQV